MILNSPIFQSGTRTFSNRTWASGLLVQMAIAETMRFESGTVRFACDQATLEQVVRSLENSHESFANMITALGTAVTAVAGNEDVVQQLGWVIEGMSELHGDILHAAADMRSCKAFEAVGDPGCIVSIPGRATTDGALSWTELPRDEATADAPACAKGTACPANAGARFARSMLRAMSAVQGGESTGPGDDDHRPLDYDAMGFEIQKYFAAAAFDSESIDFMFGFSMALAVYLYPGLTRSTLARDLLDWDPVEELQDAGFCKLDPPAPTPAATSPNRNRRKPSTGRNAVTKASAIGSRPLPPAKAASPLLERSGTAGPKMA